MSAQSGSLWERAARSAAVPWAQGETPFPEQQGKHNSTDTSHHLSRCRQTIIPTRQNPLCAGGAARAGPEQRGAATPSAETRPTFTCVWTQPQMTEAQLPARGLVLRRRARSPHREPAVRAQDYLYPTPAPRRSPPLKRTSRPPAPGAGSPAGVLQPARGQAPQGQARLCPLRQPWV